MTNPEHQIKIKDISVKVNNTRDELMKDYIIRKPFIFKGYKSEEDRIKDAVYNNRLLFNLPDYPDFQSERLGKNKNKEKNQIKNIVYNFNLEIPKKFKTINSEEDIGIINKENYLLNNNLLNSITRDSINKKNIKRRNSFLKNNYSVPRRLSIFEKKMFTGLLKNNAIYQPQMRFKARTDLERVYDMLNLQFSKENDKQVIERQLTNVDLYTFKRPKELLNTNVIKEKVEKIPNDGRKYNILPNPIIEEQKKKLEKLKNKNSIYNKRNLYFEPKNNNKKLWARKENLNIEAKRLLSSYHFKTHFKATEEIQFQKNKNKSKSPNHESKIDTCLMIPNLFNTDNNELIHKKLENFKENKLKNQYPTMLDTKIDLFNFGEDLYKEDEENIENSDYDRMIKYFRNNPYLEKLNFTPSVECMKTLNNLAFKKEIIKANDNDKKSEDKNNKSNYTYDMNKNNSKNNKKNENSENIHDIAKLILDECKVNSKKSRFNNSSLKSKSGKSMITKGLSVQDFLKKYNLKP